MKLFENKVGRPSNEILKKRKIFTYAIVATLLVIVGTATLVMQNFSNLKGAASTPTVSVNYGPKPRQNTSVTLSWNANGWGKAETFTIYSCSSSSCSNSGLKKAKSGNITNMSVSTYKQKGTWEIASLNNNAWYLASVKFKKGSDKKVVNYKFYTYNYYKLQYETNGGSAISTAKAYFASATTLSTKTKKTGYTLKCWSINNTANNCFSSGKIPANYFYRTTLKSVQTKKVYAIWTANKYQIIYNANGGTGSVTATNATYNTNAKLQSTKFKKQGYTQIGWCSDSKCSKVYGMGATVKNLTSTNNGKVTLYARWGITKTVERLGSEKSNQNIIYQYFRNKGLSKTATAAIMGNLQAESSFSPTAQNEGGCYGIAQWCDRRSNLQSFASKKGKSYSSLTVQLDFMWSELNGGYKRVLTKLKGSDSLATLTNYFCNNYERPGVSTCAESKRRNFASKLYSSVTKTTIIEPVTGK